MATLKFCIFSAVGISEPKELSHTAEENNFRLVCLHPDEASTRQLANLHPVVVSFRRNDLQQDDTQCWTNDLNRNTQPCFLIFIDKKWPRRGAYFYETACKRLLLPKDVSVDDCIGDDKLCVHLQPVLRLRAAASITLRPSFYFDAGPLCRTDARNILYFKGIAATTPLGNPFLLARGSNVFMGNRRHLTVVEINTMEQLDEKQEPTGRHDDSTQPNNESSINCASRLECECEVPTHQYLRVRNQYILCDTNSVTPTTMHQSHLNNLTKQGLYYICRTTKIHLLDKPFEPVNAPTISSTPSHYSTPHSPSSTKQHPKHPLEHIYFEMPQLQKLMAMINDQLLLLRKMAECNSSSSLSVGAGVVVHGPRRNGRKELVKQAAKRLNLPLMEPHFTDYNYHKQILELFARAKKCAPSIVLLKESEVLFPAKSYPEMDDYIPTLQKSVQDIQRSGAGVVVVCEVHRLELLEPVVRHMLRPLYLPLPTLQQRIHATRGLLKRHSYNYTSNTLMQDNDNNPTSSCEWPEDEIGAYARAMESCGMSEVCSELRDKMDCCSSKPERGLTSVMAVDFKPMAYKVPNRSFAPVTTWGAIMGYAAIKHSLKRMVELYHQDPEQHRLKGLLLYGPPGCSKTMMAKALVTQTKYAYFTLMCSVVLSKYVGESEKTLQSVIQQAKDAAPSIVFIDELECLCGDNAGASLITDLLQSVEGCAAHADGCTNVLFVAATNRPQELDERLLQSRFLERVVHVGLPDCEARCEMWQDKLDRYQTAGEFDVKRLCKATQGFSGAEIDGAYQTAARSVKAEVDRQVEADPRYDPDTDETPVWSHTLYRVTQRHLLAAIGVTNACTPAQLLRDIRGFKDQRASMALDAQHLQ